MILFQIKYRINLILNGEIFHNPEFDFSILYHVTNRKDIFFFIKI